MIIGDANMMIDKWGDYIINLILYINEGIYIYIMLIYFYNIYNNIC
jgi:hypothetical protein